MAWQDELRKLDEDLAGGAISANEYRVRRDTVLSSAAAPGRPPPSSATDVETPPRGFSGPQRRGRAAAFDSDTDEGADRLDIAADVNMLADLVASRLITPPLSIGLFGNWGTGKSFFMRRMRARVRNLADAAAAAEREAGRRGRDVSSFCSSVRQITFNAWHYAEANLWASIATHIFDHLALGGSEEDLRRRADELAEIRRTEQSLLTQLSAVRLERMLVAARHKRAPVRLGLTPADFDWIAQETGVPAATVAQVRQFAEELSGTAVEARRTWRLVRTDPRVWITIGLGAVLAVALALMVRSPIWSVIAGAVSLLAAATPVLATVRQAARRIRRAAELANSATDARLSELDAEADRLERAVSELAPGHDATAFAKSRQVSTDYQQHLGIVSLLRRDLETFAAILAKEESAGLERVVLYIDDLDRCPADVVVKVLEAIHLLVALPVFVVVVGVDPRWMRRAIQQHYDAMLTEMGPAHYLEKIFQIPFQLSPMDKAGFGSLVRGLAQSPMEPTRLAGSAAPAPRKPRPVGPPPEPWEPLELRPEQLELPGPELEFLCRFGALVPSPRAAKRLLNLYRLLRARLSTEELAEFTANEAASARAVLVLLAIHAGDGAAAEALFTEIETTPEDTWSTLLSRARTDERLEALCAALSTIEGMPEPLKLYQQRLPLVRRFSFGH